MDLADGIYNTGTATVAANGTTVTFQGATNLQASVRKGDRFGGHRGLGMRITDVGATTVTLAAPWPGPAQTAAPYEIVFTPYDPIYREEFNDIIRLYGRGAIPAMAELTLAADKGFHATGPNTLATHDLTAHARSFLATANGGATYGVLGEVPDAQLPGRLSEVGTNLTDLNLGVMGGWYRNASAATANAPVAASGVMQVIRYSATYLKQIWWRLVDGEQFERALINGVFSTWRRTAEFIVVGDGLVFRHANGFQLCAQKASMTVTSAGIVQTTGNISYPAAFSANPIVLPTFERVLPTSYDVGVGHYPGSPVTGSCRLSFWRSGGGSFPVDNVLTTHILSFGRWYN